MADERRRQSELETVFSLIEKYDGFGETRRRAENHVREAVAELAVFDHPTAHESKELLAGLAGYVLTREK